MTASHELFQKAKTLIPGGVNSPVRAFDAVNSEPVYIRRGKGAYLYTVDDRRLIDFCGSWGPLILGHARDEVVSAVKKAVEDGTSFGANCESEIEFADLLLNMIPSADKVRLVNSGTEAVMTALRLARGFTGGSNILKFEGCYHGHVDQLLVSAGSGLLTGNIASSSGVTAATVKDTVLCPYNDIHSVHKVIEAHADDLAAIIVEPIAANMGLVPGSLQFLTTLRQLADDTGALLIFDEVITGFRFAPATYGSLVGITPDLTCLGKIIGGGMPIGAVAGGKQIMDSLAPLGSVYQAGTLSGNPVALAAGIATLKLLRQENLYTDLKAKGTKISESLNQMVKKHGVTACCRALDGVFTLFFRHSLPDNLDDVKECDTERFAAFFGHMLAAGFYLSPSQYEVNFVSAAHSDADIEAFLNAADKALAKL